jgi:(p)ppGpp synthase/HD superfamily hydrolase
MAYEEARPQGRIYSENLDIVSREFGLEGLIERFHRALGRAGLADSEMIRTTLALGVDLHANDRRTYEPYAHHIVRVGIRLVEQLGVTDEVTIAAAPVHDAIEDHARELAGMRYDDVPDEVHLQRQLAYSALALIASEEVADVALEVSNPLLEVGDDKAKAYAEHTARLVVFGSPRAAALKLADFLDNSDYVAGEDPAKRTRLDRKQEPVYGMHVAGLSRPDSLVPLERRHDAYTALSRRHLHALGRLTQRREVLGRKTKEGNTPHAHRYSA